VRSSITTWTSALALLAGAGCFTTPVGAGEVACGEGGLCPDGLECVGTLCLAPGTVLDSGPTPSIDAALPIDAAAPLGAFATPVRIAELSTASAEDDPSLTGDLLEIFFQRGADIYTSKRAQATDAWPAATLVAELDSPGLNISPFVMPDGLTIYFGSDRGGSGMDIYWSTRTSRADSWGAPQVVTAPAATAINHGTADDFSPCLPSDGSVMIFASDRSGVTDLYRSVATGALTWDAPASVGVSSTADERDCWVSDDEKSLYFSSSRAGGTGTVNLYVARGNGNGNYNANQIEEVVEVNATGAATEDAWLSPDQRTMVFASDRDGNFDLYMTTR